MNIREELGKRILYFDGGMGSMLQARGLKQGELPESWNLTNKEAVKEIHRLYLEAGSDIINANTFGANRYKFDNLDEIITAGIINAREAIAEVGKDAAVALDIGSLGKLLEPLGTLAFEEAYDAFAEIIKIGDKAGADLILIETISDVYELKAAILAAKENSSLPVLCTTIFSEDGKMLTGSSPAGLIALAEGLRVDAIGINCGLGPKQMKPIFEELVKYSSTPLIITPNAGMPRMENGVTVYDVDPEEFAHDTKLLIEMGAYFAGGCCGTTPAHIKALVDATKDMNVTPITEKNHTLVSSYSACVELGKESKIIGERINPTGKSKFKQALRDNNIDYILEEGVKQADNGAHILDVNVGLPEIDEPVMMESVVKELQSILNTPLQIDTTDAVAMERAMRIYNGKPMVNSVNGKQAVMDEVFPLVAKYGGVVVGLTLDENGIPETTEGRLAIAEKIYNEAAKYGIKKKDIVIDCLTMTMSTNDESAKITLDAVKGITEKGGCTVLGVSNISFGLPAREIVNSAFYLLALDAGLSAGIINPNSAAMMQSYDTYLMLHGYDSQCMSYIDKYAGKTAVVAGVGAGAAGAVTAGSGAAGSGAAGAGVAGSGVADAGVAGAGAADAGVAGAGAVTGASAAGASASAAGASSGFTLQECIIKGLKDKAYEQTTRLLETRDAMDIINNELVPALDTVGKGYESGKMFLPQLLRSAESAQSGFDAIKEKLDSQGSSQKKKAIIIIATVKGDIHDIGKNIVKVLLENYSYEVIDLGKDVSPETIVEKVKETHAPLVGLSALMTTTVVSMEETIKLLREECPWAKVMVGGAVLTQEYSDMIGADFYGKDAMQSVYYAEGLVERGEI